MDENKVLIQKLDDTFLNMVVAAYNEVCKPGIPLENGPRAHFNVEEILEGLTRLPYLEYRMGSYITGHSKIWFGQDYGGKGIRVWVTANNDKYGRRESSMEKKFFLLLSKKIIKHCVAEGLAQK